MAKAVDEPTLPEAPRTFRDFPGVVEAAPPAEVVMPNTEPEPAKPATKKEN